MAMYNDFFKNFFIAKEFLDRKVGISEISRMISKKQEITDYIEPYYLGN